MSERVNSAERLGLMSLVLNHLPSAEGALSRLFEQADAIERIAAINSQPPYMRAPAACDLAIFTARAAIGLPTPTAPSLLPDAEIERLRTGLHELLLYARGNDHVLGMIHRLLDPPAPAAGGDGA